MAASGILLCFENYVSIQTSLFGSRTLILALILFQVFINTGAQILLKKGVSQVSFEQPVFSLMLSIATNLNIFMGVFIFVVSLLIWLYLLSKCELSYLYPFGSLSYVLAAIGGWYLFGENVTPLRLLGIAIIFIGVCCVAKS